MTAYQLITLATQIIIVIIAVLTTLDWLEHREHTRLDVMAMFGGLALLVFTQWATSLWGPNPWTGLAGGILLLAHPYLLLRLIPHFRPLPRWVMWVAIGGLAVSAVLFIAITPMLPLLTLAIVLYFVFVEGYAAFAFLRGAQATSGILRARLRLASLGSLLIAGMILLVGIGILVPVLAAILGSVGLLMSISAVVSYYFAFATPHWLRRLWQTSELQSFLYEVAGRWTDAERQETLVRLCRAAMRSMGGTGALVGYGMRRANSSALGHPSVRQSLREHSHWMARRSRRRGVPAPRRLPERHLNSGCGMVNSRGRSRQLQC